MKATTNTNSRVSLKREKSSTVRTVVVSLVKLLVYGPSVRT
jgi:hypothetical protein